MPFTPYHGGIGILLKSFFLKRFSLIIFLWSQFLYDVEVLFNILLDSNRLHSWSHTILGMMVIALISCITGKYIYEIFAKILNDIVKIKLSEHPNRKIIIFSVMLGVITHLPLDAIMHYDVRPLFPLASNNPLYGIVSVFTLHLGLLICAVIGLIVWILRLKLKKYR